MARARSLLPAFVLLAALASAQEAGGLRVALEAPWAERALVASSGGRLWEVERSPGASPERPIDLRLPAGFEYAFALVGEGGLRRSRTILSGPVVGAGAVGLGVEPRAFRRVPLRLRGTPVERVEAFDATSIATLARFPWPLSRTELSGKAAEGEVVLSESGGTLLRIQTSSGPYFRLVDPRPSEWGLELAIPPLQAVEVVDGAGGPVNGAFVVSSPAPTPDLQEEERAELALLEMNPNLWIGGIADEAGRVAFPDALHRILRVSACSPGFPLRAAEPGARRVVLAAREVRRLTLSPQKELAGLFHVWPRCPLWMPGTRYRDGVLEVAPEVEGLMVLGGEGWFFSGPVGERSELPLERPEVEFRVEPAGLPATFSVLRMGSNVAFGVPDAVPLLVEAFGEVGAGKGTRQHILSRLGVVMRSAESCALAYGARRRPGEAPGLLVFGKQPGEACTILVLDGDGKAAAGAGISYRVQGLEEAARTLTMGVPFPLSDESTGVDPSGSCTLMAPLKGSIRFMVFAEGRAPLLGAVGAGRTSRVVLRRPCWVKLEHAPDLLEVAYWRDEAWLGVDGPIQLGTSGGLPVRRFRERAGEPMVIGPLHPGNVRLAAKQIRSGGPRLLGQAILELRQGELRVLEGWKEAE